MVDSLIQRFDRYRQEIIDGKEKIEEKNLEQVKLESEKCQNRMKEFGDEEMKYIEKNRK